MNRQANAFTVPAMLSEEPFPRLLGAVTALHWTATFGVLAAAAQFWQPAGGGAPVARLIDPFLTGPLATRDAAFALAVLFLLLALAFFWLLATTLFVGPDGAGEFRDVSQLSYASGIAGMSLAGGFAAVAGSSQALLMSSALIAALFASAMALGIGRLARRRRNPRSAHAVARSMAISAAEQSLRHHFAPVTPGKAP